MGKKWKFNYSSGYHTDEKAAQEFDKRFSPKNKEYWYSHEEFSMAVRTFLE